MRKKIRILKSINRDKIYYCFDLKFQNRFHQNQIEKIFLIITKKPFKISILPTTNLLINRLKIFIHKYKILIIIKVLFDNKNILIIIYHLLYQLKKKRLKKVKKNQN